MTPPSPLPPSHPSTLLPQWLKGWLLLPLVALNGWVLLQLLHYFEPLVTIVVIASVLAFVLDYPVEFLENRKIKRSYAIVLVALFALVGLVTLGITVIPALLEQVTEIVAQLPTWLGDLVQQLQVVQTWATNHRLPINLNRWINQFANHLPDRLESLSDETLTLTLSAVGGLSSLLLTLVLTFYLLLDGKRVWKAIFQRLPFQQSEQIRHSLQRDFHRYFIGQATLSLVIGTLISILFFVLQVPYSLLLGVGVGVLALVPFGDNLGYAIVFLFLLTQSPPLAVTALTLAIVIDQIVDQAIAPRILGNLTGLQPIWIILSVVLGTRVLGIPGLLLAVPIASGINSLLEENFLPSESAPENDHEKGGAATEERSRTAIQPLHRQVP